MSLNESKHLKGSVHTNFKEHLLLSSNKAASSPADRFGFICKDFEICC